jgi:hypothetical protein
MKMSIKKLEMGLIDMQTQNEDTVHGEPGATGDVRCFGEYDPWQAGKEIVHETHLKDPLGPFVFVLLTRACR